MSKKRGGCKIAIVGSGGVGKSALVIRWIKDYFDESEEYIPTIEDSYEKIIQMDNKEVTVEILDTAGQEEYEALRDTYMRDEEGFLLVYSITDKNSAVELNQFYQHINRVKNDTKVPIVIIGNKCDLDNDRKVKKKEMVELSRDWDVLFFETSAKVNTNVDRAFRELTRECLRLREEKNPSNSSTDEKKRGCCNIL